MEHMQFEISDHLAVISIDRPERRNALSIAAMAELAEAFTRATAAPEIWAILLTGTGDLAFSAGADLKEADELAKAGLSYPHPMTGPNRNIFELVMETPKPTIAALNGAALGAGLEIALACDVRIGAEHAILGLPEAKRGMGANFASVTLPRLIHRAVAMDMLYTGRSLSAHEALAIGLLNRVVPSENFQFEARAYAEELTSNAPLTLQRYKHMALKGWELPLAAALRLDAGPNPYASADREEGVRAFLEKRKPVWSAR